MGGTNKMSVAEMISKLDEEQQAQVKAFMNFLSSVSTSPQQEPVAQASANYTYSKVPAVSEKG